jgi:hypothetical protein
MLTNTFFIFNTDNRIEKLNPFMSIIQNIDTNQTNKPDTIKLNHKETTTKQCQHLSQRYLVWPEHLPFYSQSCIAVLRQTRKTHTRDN